MAKFETYSVTPARIGNSRGYRIDASFFQAHPEMHEGSFEAAYLGAGTLLVRPRAAAPGRARRAADDADPVAAAYLAWTERAMIEQPGLLRPMTLRELEVAEALVAGVDVDLEHDRLPDDFELP
jgi:antitoxin PrlF